MNNTNVHHSQLNGRGNCISFNRFLLQEAAAWQSVENVSLKQDRDNEMLPSLLFNHTQNET